MLLVALVDEAKALDPVVLPTPLDGAEAALSTTDPEVLLTSLKLLEELTAEVVMESVELVYSFATVDAEPSEMDPDVLPVLLELDEAVKAELESSVSDVLP